MGEKENGNTWVKLSAFHVLQYINIFAESSQFPANPDGLCPCQDTAAMTSEK